MWLALLTVLLTADPVPVAGRPTDFSGAIGGPFVVTTTAEPTTVKVGEPITFTIRIVGPGDLSKMQRPELDHIKAFTAENGPARDLNPGREFQYLLRPRADGVDSIPQVKFVYFNPAIQPAERGFQTTYSESVNISVNPVDDNPVIIQAHDASALSKELIDVRFRHRRYSTSADTIPWRMLLLWGLPPVICLQWYFLVAPRNPMSAARRRALDRLRSEEAVAPSQIAATMREFLSAMIGRDLSNFTAFEVGQALSTAKLASDLTEKTTRLLHDCERAQFAGDSPNGLTERASKIVQAWSKSP